MVSADQVDQSKGIEEAEEQVLNQQPDQKVVSAGDLSDCQRDLFAGDWRKKRLFGGCSGEHFQRGDPQEKQTKKKSPQPGRETVKALIASTFHIDFDKVELMPVSKYITLFRESLNIGNFSGKDVHLMLYGKTKDQLTLEEFREKGLLLTQEKIDGWTK